MTSSHFRMGMILGSLAAAMALTGCTQKIVPEQPGAKHKDGDVVVRVDGKEMDWKDVDLRARSYLKDEVDSHSLFIPPGHEDEALQFFRRKAVMLFVNKTVLLDEAKRRGLKVSDAERQASIKQFEPLLKEHGIASMDDLFKKSPIGEKATRAEFEDGLYVDKLIDADVRSKMAVTDADRDTLTNEIITNRKAARAKIDALRAKLLKGGDFAALARDNSDDASKRTGGDLGEFPRGRMDKAFEDAAFSQKVNEIGPVVETRYGYHVIKVTAHTPAKAATATTPATPETVHASHILIKAPPMVTGKEMDLVIQRRKYEEGLKTLLAGLRAKAKIETIYSDGPYKLVF